VTATAVPLNMALCDHGLQDDERRVIFQSMRIRSSLGRLRVRLAPTLPWYLEHLVADAQSVLDLGCGTHSPLGQLSRRPPYSVGVDAFPDALRESQAKRIHEEYRQLDVRKVDEEFAPRSFDVVLALDLLEHLARRDGEELLAKMEHIARRRVVVFTPNGFITQGPHGGNPLQVHKSGWTVKQMRHRGYTVRGVNGIRGIRGEGAEIRLKPLRFWGYTSDLSQPLARRLPALAFQILCVKELANSSDLAP
jgi:SAM-dependent methyltransferase